MDEQFEDLSEARTFACAKCGGTGCETGKIRAQVMVFPGT